VRISPEGFRLGRFIERLAQENGKKSKAFAKEGRYLLAEEYRVRATECELVIEALLKEGLIR
jgi:hypothetical protein